jgi:hypothetical protein
MHDTIKRNDQSFMRWNEFHRIKTSRCFRYREASGAGTWTRIILERARISGDNVNRSYTIIDLDLILSVDSLSLTYKLKLHRVLVYTTRIAYMVIYIVAACCAGADRSLSLPLLVVLHVTCLTKVNSLVKVSYAQQTLCVYPGRHPFRAFIEIELRVCSLREK